MTPRGRSRIRVPEALLFLLLLGPLAPAVAEEVQTSAPGPLLVVVQPGYPGSPRDAQPFMRRLAAYLAEKAAWEGLRCEYHNVPDEALAALEKARASAGIVSLGFYLRHRKTLGLRAVLESRPEERFCLVAAAGAGRPKPADLAGQPVAGGALYEYEFLRRVAFADLEGVGSWKLEPSLRISRSLRRLERGEHRGLVLTGREHRALEKASLAKSLEKIAESDYYPPALYVVFEGVQETAEREAPRPEERDADAQAARRASEALRRLDGDPEGKEILETMGNEGFRPVRSEWLEELEKRYDAQQK
ncbi:MAG: hypothetical protein JXA90_03555 [Planctomycetes bacterium]|nr:hypothetical protein [Planctomycetota bacterium]